jgi:hypothetical protein
MHETHCVLKRGACLLVLVGAVLLGSGCVAPVPKPHELVAPSPIRGTSGKYMCPYTTDGVLAEWVDKAVNARIASGIGKATGAYIGRKAFEQIPILGGILGGMVGDAAGRKIAIEASGGMAYIRDTSDLSFNRIEDMAVYLYVVRSSHAHYNNALRATWEIYPELQRKFVPALRGAQRKYTGTRR